MTNLFSPSPWKAVNYSGSWQIVGKDDEKIAVIEQSPNSAKNARLIAASPYVLEALKSMVALIGDEDMADNGELSGAAISDMARAAIEMVSGL